MARNYRLKERGTGVTLYPETTTEQVYAPGGDSLKNLLPRMQEQINSKQGEITTSVDLELSAANELGLTGRAKQRLFDDMFTQAAGRHGMVDHSHVEADGKSAPYLCNGIWLTYGEAVRVVEAGRMTVSDSNALYWRNKGIRTILPPRPIPSVYPCDSTFRECTELEVVPDANYEAQAYCFYGCVKLHTASCYNIRADSAFEYCSSLVSLKMLGPQKENFSLQWSPLLSLESVTGILGRCAPGLTFTVHPDIYARLTDGANAEWHKVLADALEKNISFATV